MKLSLILLSTLFCFSAFSNIPDLPEGEYTYSETEVHSTRHEHIISTISEAGKKLYKDYRELGYSCARKTNRFVKCRKVVSDNPNSIEFKVEGLEKLSPKFGTLIAVDIIREAEAVDQFQVTQEVSFLDSSTNEYKVYQNHTRNATYLDIQTELITPIRFQFKNGLLTRLSFEKERLQKNEILVHTLISTYK